MTSTGANIGLPTQISQEAKNKTHVGARVGQCIHMKILETIFFVELHYHCDRHWALYSYRNVGRNVLKFSFSKSMAGIILTLWAILEMMNRYFVTHQS